ncbi:hypothetical protein C2G38_2205165 [Gigaspora rosea]|uniref:Uncharacterized protein n=1 Tax=Gigaspora rosea TaxID=44941 RepID=A0A397UNH7_9GLOM|nr:hypothetical protein C2G38_2205165 [Gigaspora rosea]
MLNHRDSAIWVGGNSNAHNGVPPKRLGNVAIRPSRPAPITIIPSSILPILPTNSSSPSLDHSFPTREDLEIVSPENSFPNQISELWKLQNQITAKNITAFQKSADELREKYQLVNVISHPDSVTTLDIDPSGMILVSGGHDSSIRLWDIVSTTRVCIASAKT